MVLFPSALVLAAAAVVLLRTGVLARWLGWVGAALGGFRYAEDQTYAGRKGAVVFETEAVRDGRRVHIRHVNVKGRSWGYNGEFITSVDRWDASRALARQFEQAFQPLG